MAVLDYLMELSDAQSLTSISSGSSTISTNVMDFQSGDKDAFGSSVSTNRMAQTMKVMVGVHTALVGSSADLEVQLVSKASSASISASGTVHGVVRIPATSAAGYRTSISVPTQDLNRYVGLLYTARGAQLTSATVNAWMGLGTGEIID